MRLGKTFQLLSSPATNGCAARLGRLALPGRRVIETPNYTAVTSRGAVPHLTPDNLSKHTTVGAAYLALEDFIEKKEPPIYNSPAGDHGRFHSFTSLPPDRTTILAARRCPPVMTPMGNGVKTVSLLTSTGYTGLTVPQFASAVETLQPDVVVALGDALHTSATPASKKLFRMVERTETWVDEFLQHVGGRERLDELGISLFAPVLPVEHPIQWDYLRHLAEDVADELSGLAIYDVNILPELASYSPLAPLPRLSLNAPRTPHEVLRQVALGVDLCAIPFVNSVSDAGVALVFTFPPPAATETLSLGVDMWSPEHSTSVTPLLEGCQCYACTSHHRAYLHHLLNAKEMLGWVLLQIHNQHVFGEFFAGVRRSLGNGVGEFEQDRQRFRTAYEPELPEGSGERPRARGYHFKSEAAQERMNKPSWTDFEAKVAEPA
ncbi:queuine tRNA-ribosyltransferase domain-containing protein [Hirsutella rhossiliensis]|uniref:Queuine tRNA-ribosyltransferase accessory subunit 2 n=1 Tax=Hirsutella rhossiliensis TaxID=111463 RepID=A0A9P8SKN7_9HYPO|nr:queuine tRNA-ribosyltransferase domain-containing protein [Hirsutella rhossiliensis]KAH0964970.1 queuine tRNA-ribosyltransferase domain-containing protein [Hirsutella rhossiliensis]